MLAEEVCVQLLLESCGDLSSWGRFGLIHQRGTERVKVLESDSNIFRSTPTAALNIVADHSCLIKSHQCNAISALTNVFIITNTVQTHTRGSLNSINSDVV